MAKKDVIFTVQIVIETEQTTDARAILESAQAWGEIEDTVRNWGHVRDSIDIKAMDREPHDD